jgi:ParB family chromosome partitioning protein
MNTNFAALVGGLVEDSGEPDGSRLKELALSEVYEDPSNPRTGFNDAEIADLAASMREHKVLQPITVRPKDDRGYMIRFGARRFRAAQLAGLETIPAVISTSDASEIDILAAQVIENDQREPLNTGEMTTAVGRLMALGLNQAQVAGKLGRSKEAISIYAALRDLPPELKALAPKLGARTLYELSTAWKRDPTRAQALVAERGDAITMREAVALSADVKPAPKGGKAVADAPSAKGKGSAKAGAGEGSLHVQTQPDAEAVLAKSAAPRGKLAGFDVKVGKRTGRLLLEPGPNPETALVAFDSGQTEPTAVADIRLVRARSA